MQYKTYVNVFSKTKFNDFLSYSLQTQYQNSCLIRSDICSYDYRKINYWKKK